MGLVNKEDILLFLNNWHEIEKFKFEGLISNNPAYTEGVLDAINSFIQQIKAMPCMNEENLSKEHEHDYFLAKISESYYRDKNHIRPFRYGTLVCRKCGELKEITVES